MLYLTAEAHWPSPHRSGVPLQLPAGSYLLTPAGRGGGARDKPRAEVTRSGVERLGDPTDASSAGEGDRSSGDSVQRLGKGRAERFAVGGSAREIWHVASRGAGGGASRQTRSADGGGCDGEAAVKSPRACARGGRIFPTVRVPAESRESGMETLFMIHLAS